MCLIGRPETAGVAIEVSPALGLPITTKQTGFKEFSPNGTRLPTDLHKSGTFRHLSREKEALTGDCPLRNRLTGKGSCYRAREDSNLRHPV